MAVFREEHLFGVRRLAAAFLPAGLPAGPRRGTVSQALVLLALLFASTASAGSSPPFDVTVDPRVELMAVVFRLAGNPEYAATRPASYLEAIDKHFATVKDHPAITAAQQLRQNRGVSYDAPMTLALHLSNPPELTPMMPLDPPPPGLDGRWSDNAAAPFLDQLRDFAEVSQFQRFFDGQRAYYNEAITRAYEVLAKEAHLEWFDSFFGARPGQRFHVILGLANGHNCYGPRVVQDGLESIYCILGVWHCDWQGRPKFDKGMMDIVAHEFCHSYVNPLAARYAGQLEKPGKRIQAEVEDKMDKLAYTHWSTVLHESIVRAAVVRYLATTRNRWSAWAQLRNEAALGFFWIGDLEQLLCEYESQREKYPTFRSFFSRIVLFMRATAAELDE